MCECVEAMNAQLKPHNGRLANALRLSDGMSKLHADLLVETEKLDKSKRKPVPKVLAAFCPFCGEQRIKGDQS